MVLTDDTFRINGQLKISSIRPDGTVRDSREGKNIMCTAGKTVIAAALAWSGIQDQAAAIGSVQTTRLTPLWGAVGSGAGTVAASDTALFTELGRQTVGAGAFTPATASIPAQFIWLFYFPAPPTTWTVTEAGVFANGSSNKATIATAGFLMDHWSFGGSPISVPTVDTLILQASFSIT